MGKVLLDRPQNGLLIDDSSYGTSKLPKPLLSKGKEIFPENTASNATSLTFGLNWQAQQIRLKIESRFNDVSAKGRKISNTHPVFATKQAQRLKVIEPTLLTGADLKKWTGEKNKLLTRLKDKNSDCYKYLKEKGFEPEKLAENLAKQKPYDALRSRNDAGMDFGRSFITVKEMFEEARNQRINEGKKGVYDDAATGNTGKIYYTKLG